MDKKVIRYALKIYGIVQGVGFRPFLYRLANSHFLSGFAYNTAYGVYTEIEGTQANCDVFLRLLKEMPPPLSHITAIDIDYIPAVGERSFSILKSVGGTPHTFISPDIGICNACKEEISDPKNRRFKYPFTNCTNCGPRFSIIRDIPYDRKNTTMSGFALCTDCAHEYTDPLDRRFHAQPNACAVCGPTLSFYVNGVPQSGDPIELFADWIHDGKIIAVKGLGGYHLACDAKNTKATTDLRARKQRDEKPFAVMARDIETVKRFCFVSAEEEALLCSNKNPIVLLHKRTNCPVSSAVAPYNMLLGVFLPYTPLHCLLMEQHEMLVMTSANFSDQPMLFTDDNIANNLDNLADAVLAHNRPIQRRVDDSICRIINATAHIIRRARGYAPEPLPLRGNNKTILALGAQQKNTFCLAINENAFLSSHIGDLSNFNVEQSLCSEVKSFLHLFQAKPELIACDAHPDYTSTHLAHQISKNISLIKIQHHRAHFASVLAEHNLHENAIGFIFDGTGYGDDGTIWGGEIFFGNITRATRIGHLFPFPLLGGERAVLEPWRCAISLLDIALGKEQAIAYFPEKNAATQTLLQAKEANINTPLSTSMGRLFDGIAAISGIRQLSSYEGQAAIEFEQACYHLDKTQSYHLDLIYKNDGMVELDWRPLIRCILNDRMLGISIGEISAKFHMALVDIIVRAACYARAQYHCNTIALSGGCFQNAILLQESINQLTEQGFDVYTNEIIPVNDGGISYGQAAIAATIEEEPLYVSRNSRHNN